MAEHVRVQSKLTVRTKEQWWVLALKLAILSLFVDRLVANIVF